MKPSQREDGHADFLSNPFVHIPYTLIVQLSQLKIRPGEFVVLIQILSASQIDREMFVSPQTLAIQSGMSSFEVSQCISNLVQNGCLAIGERSETDGTLSHYYDLKPLWSRLRGQNPLQSEERVLQKNPVTVFEEEFGRPLSGIECEQIRYWLDHDGHSEWILVEALREAVLANKYSFKYIDRILFDWQRNRIRTKQQLETYRQSYRERVQGQVETASTSSALGNSKKTRRDAVSRDTQPTNTTKDDRYAAFYHLFPDS